MLPWGVTIGLFYTTVVNIENDRFWQQQIHSHLKSPEDISWYILYVWNDVHSYSHSFPSDSHLYGISWLETSKTTTKSPCVPCRSHGCPSPPQRILQGQHCVGTVSLRCYGTVFPGGDLDTRELMKRAIHSEFPHSKWWCSIIMLNILKWPEGTWEESHICSNR